MIYVPCVKVASTAMKGNTLVDHEYDFVYNCKKEIPDRRLKCAYKSCTCA